MPKYTLIVSEEQRAIIEYALEHAPTPEADVDESELLIGMIADALPDTINDCTL